MYKYTDRFDFVDAQPFTQFAVFLSRIGSFLFGLN